MSTHHKAARKGFGYERGESIGTHSNGQFTLHSPCTYKDREWELARFALLPDTFVIRAEGGHRLTMGELRQGLRDARKKSGRLPLATSGVYPNLPEGIHGIFPLSIEEQAAGWLTYLFGFTEKGSEGGIVHFIFMKRAVGSSMRELRFIVRPAWGKYYHCDVLIHYSENIHEWEEWCEIRIRRPDGGQDVWRKQQTEDWKRVSSLSPSQTVASLQGQKAI